MSTIEEAIFTRCTTHAGLSALIGTRCYPVQFPGSDETDDDPNLSDVEYPALRYQRISDPDVASSLDDTGPAGMGRPRFQFDIYAESAGEAKAVGDQVVAAWENFRGVVAGVSIYRGQKVNRRDGYEDEVNLYRESLDFFIWHGPVG